VPNCCGSPRKAENSAPGSKPSQSQVQWYGPRITLYMEFRRCTWIFQRKWCKLCQDNTQFCCEIFIAMSKHPVQSCGFTNDSQETWDVHCGLESGRRSIQVL
ncbi:hypothetical protein KI387_018086, partial [Taxus chinensis]